MPKNIDLRQAGPELGLKQNPLRGSLPVCFACLLVLMSAFLFLTGCFINSGNTTLKKVDGIARPYAFDLLGWEIRALFDKAWSPVREWFVAEPCPGSSVVKYFNLSSDRAWILNTLGENEVTRAKLDSIRREQMALSRCVENALEGQVRKALVDNGIGSPFGQRVGSDVFPPVIFKLEEPPKLLIISPREKIMLWHRVTLRQDLTLEQREHIESLCDSLGVSSLVEDTGGMATYPSMVSMNGGIRYTIETVIEEWVHQYLAFKPLGFRYLLDIWGIRRDPEIVTINETVAGIVSKELADAVYTEHYERYSSIQPPLPAFDFNREMRVTRVKVDELLANGQVTAAEQYMEERRQVFIKNGYYIRKLNQAYFAFYGTYGHNPASVSPVYADLQRLRSMCPSLADFLERAASVTSYPELRALIWN